MKRSHTYGTDTLAQQTSVRAEVHTPWTQGVPQNTHTPGTLKQSHTRALHTGTGSPLQASEAPTPVSHPQVWPGCPSPPSFPDSDAPPREAQPLGRPSSSLRPDKVLERSREAAPALRRVGETGGGARSPTPLLLSPDAQLRTRGVWTGVSASVSLPHAGDTLRTCAYLAWEAPRGAPSASPDLQAPLVPLDTGVVRVRVTPRALQAASCPWAAKKLRPGRREVTQVRALGASALWSLVLAGVPWPPRPPPAPPRRRPAARTLLGA